MLLVVTYGTGESSACAVTADLAEMLLQDDLTLGLSTSAALGPAGSATTQLEALAEVTISPSGLVSAERRIASLLDPACHTLLRVEAGRIASYERTWELGVPSPGERLVSLVRRKDSLSRKQFADYWRDVHAPVAMSFSVLPSSYTQYLVTRPITGHHAAPDGVMVMHFLQPDDRRARWEDHPEEAARGLRDAARFMDMSAPASAVMRETIWR